MKLPFAQMGAANAMSGCGPAFMSMVLEALGDGGVKHGLTRTQAYTLAACGMEGTAKLQLETGLHPGVLKDQVCSPGGVTIRGVAALEENGCAMRCSRLLTRPSTYRGSDNEKKMRKTDTRQG